MATRRPTWVPPDTVLWEDSAGGRWALRVTTWAVVDGRTEPVGVELRSARMTGDDADDWATRWLPPNSDEDDNPTGHRPIAVTTTAWRALPLAALLSGLRQRHADDLAELLGAESPMLQRWKAPRRRRGVVSQEAVAQVYLAAREAGQAPTKAVMTEFSLSKNAAANRVRRARQDGLIPPTTRGRATGGAIPDERHDR